MHWANDARVEDGVGTKNVEWDGWSSRYDSASDRHGLQVLELDSLKAAASALARLGLAVH